MALDGPTIAGYAQTILSAVVAEFEAQDVSLPAVQAVIPGLLPAADGPQLTVGLVEIAEGFTGGASAAFIRPDQMTFKIEFRVQLFRQVPTPDDSGNAPGPQALTTAGMQTIGDAMILFLAGEKIKASGLLVPVGVPITVGPCTPLPDEGGLSGSELPLAWTMVG